jgi:hypothetical protein
MYNSCAQSASVRDVSVILYTQLLSSKFKGAETGSALRSSSNKTVRSHENGTRWSQNTHSPWVDRSTAKILLFNNEGPSQGDA